MLASNFRVPLVEFSAANPSVGDAVWFPGDGLATNVADLSRFMNMWMNGYAPSRNGRPILQDATIAAAGRTLFPSNTAPAPDDCKKEHKDPGTSFAYRACVKDAGFGVFWGVATSDGTTFIQHNGNHDHISGGDLRIDLDPKHKIGAVALISTQPHPVEVAKIAPPGVRPNFIEYQVETNLLDQALQEDGSTGWSTAPLSRGVARLLWLSGETLSRAQLQDHPLWLLNQFSPGFIAAHRLTAKHAVTIIDHATPVEGYVRADMFGDVHNCSTFRVRRVDDDRTISVRLQCLRRNAGLSLNFDVVLKVDDQGRIDDLSEMGSTTEAF
jgi:hypothetical protein